MRVRGHGDHLMAGGAKVVDEDPPATLRGADLRIVVMAEKQDSSCGNHLGGISSAQPQRHQRVQGQETCPEHMGRVGCCRVAGDQGRDGQNTGENTQRSVEEGDSPMRPARLLDSLIDVLSVGQEDVLSLE